MAELGNRWVLCRCDLVCRAEVERSVGLRMVREASRSKWAESHLEGRVEFAQVENRAWGIPAEGSSMCTAEVVRRGRGGALRMAP